MGDTFLEYIIKRKPEPKTSLLKVAIILATVVICYFGLILLNHGLDEAFNGIA